MDTTAVRRREPDESTLPAGALTLERRADGRLWATRGDAERAVWVRRCFPWSEPARFVSLRDDQEAEFGWCATPPSSTSLRGTRSRRQWRRRDLSSRSHR